MNCDDAPLELVIKKIVSKNSLLTRLKWNLYVGVRFAADSFSRLLRVLYTYVSLFCSIHDSASVFERCCLPHVHV